MRVIPATPPDVLTRHVDAGLLSAADVHVAATVCRVTGTSDPDVLLAAALAVRAPRLQHVCVDLREVRRLVPDDDPRRDDRPPVGPDELWPDDVDAWRERLAASPTVALVDDPHGWQPPPPGADVAPLVLVGHRLYLDRLWRDEVAVARALTARAARLVDGVDPVGLAPLLQRLFDGPEPDQQRHAARTAALRHLAVVAGGPGTGKTTTVARLLALLDDHAAATGAPAPTVALAAPTGKAAQRLTASLREAADALGRDADDPTVQRLRTAEAVTLHRLLGPRPDNRSRFRHDARAPLPHDLAVVDETSMVSLALIARLLDAVRPDARLVLLGDPEQLASVEAGSVLGDIVASTHAPTAPVAHPHSPAAPPVATTAPPDAPTRRSSVDAAIVVLDRVHRFRADSGIAEVAAAIQQGDADAVLARLRRGGDVAFVELAADHDEGRALDQPGDPDTVAGLAAVREVVAGAAASIVDAARAGDATGALALLDEVRVLCAHRRGAGGVEGWVARIEGWLAAARPGAGIRGRAYPGRPVLVTANDPRTRLVNGDVGVLVRAPQGGVEVALPSLDGTGVRRLAPSRLPAAETVHAMTIHKSQGSQLRHVVVALPALGSPLLTRELLYTAVTRGRERATVIGSEPALRAAVTTRAVRASGLGEALRR